MLNKTLSRRAFMTASASIGGLAVLTAGLPLSSGLIGLDETATQKQYMIGILDKYTGHTQPVKPEYIQLFADRFAEVYGVVDYQTLFSGPIGEYRLIKLFLKSVFRPS